MYRGPSPTWFFIAFPVLWCLVSAMLSAIGGWWMLAMRFRAEGLPPAGRRWLVWGSLGVVAYRSCLIVGHSEAGLHLAVLPPFRLFHPPLLIPWAAIARRERGRYWLLLCDTLEISGDRAVRLRLRVGTTGPFESHLPPIAVEGRLPA
jgi:hypothetical protein